jgi:hypothetical protein
MNPGKVLKVPGSMHWDTLGDRSLIFVSNSASFEQVKRLTSPACKRETPLSEMNPTSTQIDPHHIHLWTGSIRIYVSGVCICHPVACDDQNTVFVIEMTVLSHAAPGAALLSAPARSPLVLFSAICND